VTDELDAAVACSKRSRERAIQRMKEVEREKRVAAALQGTRTRVGGLGHPAERG
jgi:hypothetical protein